jgi:hypothetical protein
MDWVKKHYDIALLALATLVLVANAALVLQKSTAIGDSFSIPRAPEPSNEFTSPDLAVIASANTAASAPATWSHNATSESQGSLFASRTYILGKDDDGSLRLVDPVEGGENLHPPITNAWLILHKLDYSDSGIKERDNDNDGFTNLEEFNAVPKTDPNDAQSTPPSFTKLELLAFQPKPFRLVFKGDGGTDGDTFQINLKDLAGANARTQYKKKGDTIDGAPYKIVDHTPKPGPNGLNATGDISELVIENLETGETIVLVYNKELDDPTSFGEFRNQLSGETFTLKKGEQFSLPPDTAKFKLIDIDSTSAQIQDVATGQTSKVMKSDTQAAP